MGKKHKSVKDPDLDVFTKHIRPVTEEEWNNRAPSGVEKRSMAISLNSIKGVNRELDFKFGYTTYYMTLRNANEKWVNNWIQPKTKEKALNGEDVNDAVSLVARDGYEMGSGHKVNLITARTDVVESLLEMYNEDRKNIRFVAITDKEKTPASSITSQGDQPSNVYMLDFMTDEEIEERATFHNKSLDNF